MASPVTIASSVGASMSAATGRPGQGHLVYAANQAAWWLLYLTSTQSLSALYSSGFGSWTAPSGDPFALGTAHNSLPLNFGFLYGNIASTDVLYAFPCYLSGFTGDSYAARFTLGTTWSNTNAESLIVSGSSDSTVSGITGCFDSSNKVFIGTGYGTGSRFSAVIATNSDSGTSWSAGWGTEIQLINQNYESACAVFSLGSGNVLMIADNGSANTTYTNLLWTQYSGTWSGIANVFGASVTATDKNNWGAVARTTSDIHCVSIVDNSSNYVHFRFNGSSWSAGDSVPTLAYGTLSGIFLASDGTLVYAHVIDSSGNVQQSIWTSGTGWSAWSNVCAIVSHTRAFLSGCQTVIGGNVGLIWTELNGSQYDIIGALVSVSASNDATLGVTTGDDALAGAAVNTSPSALAVTEGADSLAGDGVFTTDAALAVTEGADSLAGDGVFTTDAALAVTEGADSLAGDGVFTTDAALAVTEGADSLAGDGAMVTSAAAALAVTEGADTLRTTPTPTITPDITRSTWALITTRPDITRSTWNQFSG